MTSKERWEAEFDRIDAMTEEELVVERVSMGMDPKVGDELIRQIRDRKPKETTVPPEAIKALQDAGHLPKPGGWSEWLATRTRMTKAELIEKWKNAPNAPFPEDACEPNAIVDAR